jgi:hypothetical protein
MTFCLCGMRGQYWQLQRTSQAGFLVPELNPAKGRLSFNRRFNRQERALLT